MMNLTPMLQAVRYAVLLCQEVQQQSLRGMNKSDGKDDPVTLADYGSQAIIARALQAHFPDDAVISEESATQFLDLTTPEQRSRILSLLIHVLDENITQEDIVSWLDHGKHKQAARTWVIDPIDGTKGFLAMRHYAVAVGIVTDGHVTGGILAAPVYEHPDPVYSEGALFFAQEGQAYRQPLSLPIAEAQPERIHVSTNATPATVRFVQSFEKQHASKDRMARLRELAGFAEPQVAELDSMSKYAMVACGDAEVYLRLPTEGNKYPHYAWDHAAGVALIQAAGGMATDCDGSPLIFSQGAIMPNQGMLVSNGQFHDKLVAAAQAVLK